MNATSNTAAAPNASVDLRELLRRHGAAVAAFANQARLLTSIEAGAPRAPGKWTPAQETTHLALGYRAFTSAISGGQELAPRVSVERALHFRETVLPRILAGGWFPRGAESPDEAVPHEPVMPLPRGADELEAAAHAFHEVVASAFDREPTFRARHPYFGPLLLPDLVVLLTAHAEHHRRNLPVVEHNSDHS